MMVRFHPYHKLNKLLINNLKKIGDKKMECSILNEKTIEFEGEVYTLPDGYTTEMIVDDEFYYVGDNCLSSDIDSNYLELELNDGSSLYLLPGKQIFTSSEIDEMVGDFPFSLLQ